MTRRLRVLVVPAGLVAAVAVLAAAGRGGLAPPPASPRAFGEHVEGVGALTAAVAVLRLGALVVAGWSALVAGVAASARLLGAVRLAAAAERALPSSLRRVMAGLGGAGVASVVALAGAGAAAAAGPPEPVGAPLVLLPADGEGTATMSVLRDEPPPAEPVVEPAVDAEPVIAPDPPPPSDEWVVLPGESFWSIAGEVLVDVSGRAPTDAEVDRYWRRLIDANRDRLVTPNPDFLRPGQVLVLPPSALEG